MNDSKVKLYIFSGLPGTGKTTLARLLARRTGSVFLRIDTVEQGIRELCSFDVQGEGYRLSYRIAKDNLLNGLSVVADSCNPIQLTRREWNAVAIESGVDFVNVELVCSDMDEHRKRVETRKADIANFKLPSWHEVENRHYEEWEELERITIDTAGKSVDESFGELLDMLKP